jgi:hypothetical protein
MFAAIRHVAERSKIIANLHDVILFHKRSEASSESSTIIKFEIENRHLDIIFTLHGRYINNAVLAN